MKAYNRRKNRAAIPALAEKHVFFMDEYELFLREMSLDSEIVPLIVYCFFRKNLKGERSVDQICTYFNAVWPALHKIDENDIFRSFQDEFFSGIHTIEAEKPNWTEPKEL